MHLIINNNEVLAIAPSMALAEKTIEEIKHRKTDAIIAYLPDVQARAYLADQSKAEWQQRFGHRVGGGP